MYIKRRASAQYTRSPTAAVCVRDGGPRAEISLQRNPAHISTSTSPVPVPSRPTLPAGRPLLPGGGRLRGRHQCLVKRLSLLVVQLAQTGCEELRVALWWDRGASDCGGGSEGEGRCERWSDRGFSGESALAGARLDRPSDLANVIIDKLACNGNTTHSIYT